MKIQVLTGLNEKQLRKVQALLKDCQDYEPVTITPPLAADSCFQPGFPCFYLLFENQDLISFLALFLPDQYYGEAMGFTHPMARRRGYFKQLWNEALDRLDGYIEDMELLFVTDGNSPDALAALKAMEGEYQYSEFMMEKEMAPVSENTTKLQIKPAEGHQAGGCVPFHLCPVQFSAQTLAQCTDIHEAIFLDGRSASEAFIREIWETSGSSTWLAYHNDRLAGIFHLTEWESGTYLSGFGILPELQGQGLGRALLHAIPACLRPGHTLLSLQVGSLNEAAFRLYQTEGFMETSCRHYYY